MAVGYWLLVIGKWKRDTVLQNRYLPIPFCLLPIPSKYQILNRIMDIEFFGNAEQYVVNFVLDKFLGSNEM